MKDKLGGKMMKKFVVGLRVKTFSYLIDDGSENKKPKGTKRCVIKKTLNLKIIKNCFESTQFQNKINFQKKNIIEIDGIKKHHKELIKTITQY